MKIISSDGCNQMIDIVKCHKCFIKISECEHGYNTDPEFTNNEEGIG